MNYDVAVIGGGPAGLSAAAAAAGAGARVAVLEKSREIGFPIHTSGASWIDELQLLGIPERFMSPVREAVFLAPAATAFFKYAKPPSCVLDIRGLYQYLGEQASAAGAEIFVNTTALGPCFEQNRLTGVQFRRFGQVRLLKAPLLIDASGAGAVLARRMGLTTGFTRVGVGAEYDLYAPQWPRERVGFLFGNSVAPAGYAWIFPHGEQRVRIGVGVLRPQTRTDPKLYLERLLNEHAYVKKELGRVSRLEYHIGVIPAEIYLPRTVSDGLLVVGDAGGLISTLLGEGIRFAIAIGRHAGTIAAEAVRRERFDAAFLCSFERIWQRNYGRLFRVGAFVNARLAGYSDEQWDRRIRQLGQLNPDLVPPLLKGDFNLKFLLQLMKANPVLLTKATVTSLKSLLKSA